MNLKRKSLQIGGSVLTAGAFALFLATTAIKNWSSAAVLIAGGILSLSAGTYLLVKTDSEDLLKKISELPRP